MNEKKSKFEIVQEEAQNAVNKTNIKIEELGDKSNELSTQLIRLQNQFDKIRNIPTEKKLEHEHLKEIRLIWKKQAEKIESDCKKTFLKNTATGMAEAGIGVAVATLGPTAAMGIATTFGVASTGTAISTLSGAAATNAALAWLGGGALATGGGGIAAGNLFLTFFGPVGWTIAGFFILTSGLMMMKSFNDKNKLENIFSAISQRDVNSYKLAIVELNERIARIQKETDLLKEANSITETFGIDYNLMTEMQQYQLGSFLNLMLSSTQLLVNPILGLQPKYTLEDYGRFIKWGERKSNDALCIRFMNPIISLCCFLYKIDLDKNEQKLIYNTLRSNKELIESLNIESKDFNIDIINCVFEALNFKYES